MEDAYKNTNTPLLEKIFPYCLLVCIVGKVVFFWEPKFWGQHFRIFRFQSFFILYFLRASLFFQEKMDFASFLHCSVIVQGKCKVISSIIIKLH